jgi:hypothetical protein
LLAAKAETQDECGLEEKVPVQVSMGRIAALI